MIKACTLLFALVAVFATIPAVADTGVCGVCSCIGPECYCGDPPPFVLGRCGCKVSTKDLGGGVWVSMCQVQGEACLTGWLCQGNSPPWVNGADPEPELGVGVSAAFAGDARMGTILAELEVGDGYVQIAGEPVLAGLRVTAGGVVYVSIAGDGTPLDFAAIDGSRITLRGPSRCKAPMPSGGVEAHRQWLTCAYGVEPERVVTGQEITDDPEDGVCVCPIGWDPEKCGCQRTQ